MRSWKGEDGKRQKEIIGKHEGLKWENIKFEKNLIVISNMDVVKRSKQILEKHGTAAATREPFIIPLQRELFENPYWDQLVPFGWLILEFLRAFAPPKGSLFEYERKRAWQIIRHVTGQYPNWFRAQAEHFYGHYLLADSVKLAAFVKVVNPSQVRHYIGHSWKEYLKGQRGLDFDWIDQEVVKIHSRMRQSRKQ